MFTSCLNHDLGRFRDEEESCMVSLKYGFLKRPSLDPSPWRGRPGNECCFSIRIDVWAFERSLPGSYIVRQVATSKHLLPVMLNSFRHLLHKRYGFLKELMILLP